jgi:CheY-like chemotaxis protein
VVFLFLRKQLIGFLSKDNVSIKVAGMEISVAEAAKNIGTQISDLQNKVAELESRLTTGKSSIEPKRANTQAIEQSSKKRSSSSKRKAVLWVDDYPINNAFLVEKFRSSGIEVDLALSTKQALAYLDAKDYALAISDLGRKEKGIENPMAGLDFVKAARRRDMQLPILIFAGPRGIENKNKLVSAGVNEVTVSTVEVVQFVKSYIDV